MGERWRGKLEGFAGFGGGGLGLYGVFFPLGKNLNVQDNKLHIRIEQ
jgi:hypothetical protein